MKSVLGLLLCLVLGTAQTFAISGGPVFGTGNISTTGTYAGVLTPGPLSPGANSIGLFSLTIPKTGLGTGTVVIFAAGLTYTGTFQGTADPDTARLIGEIDATSTVEIGDSGGVEIAVGRMLGRIKPNKNFFSTATARLVGTSNIQFSFAANDPFTQIDYKVRGFKQSDT